MFRYKVRRFFIILFLLIVKDLILIIAILNSPYLQGLIAKKCIEFFADNYNIELSIGNVYLKIPDEIVLSDIEMKDSCGNVLLSANDLGASVERISFKNNFLVLSEIMLSNPYINATIDEKGNANYDYILKKFASDEPTNWDFNVICKKVSIENGHLKYIDKRYDNSAATFKPSDMDINDFNLEISRFRYTHDTLNVNIDNFSLNEKSGIAVNRMSGKVKYHSTGISLNDLKINTNYSELACSEITVKGQDSTYLSNPMEKIEKLTVNIDTIIFSVADLAPFLTQYEGYTDSIHLRGNFSGRLDDFKFKNFGISMYGGTRLYANLSVNGFPNIEQTIVFGNISDMQTNKNDLNRILKLVSPQNPVQIPSVLDNLDRIAFNGNLSGMLNDMMAFGQLTTNFGTIKTDIALMPDWKNKTFEYDGIVSAKEFNLHDIVPGDNGLGMLTMNINVSGSVDSLSHTRNTLNGKIHRLDFNGYAYSNINVRGNLTNTAFNGNININDPNLSAEIIGNYNFAGNNNNIELSSDISADLKELHLAQENVQDSKIKFVISAQLEGDIANRPTGHITLGSAEFNIDEKRITIDRLNATARIDDEKKYNIKVDSDILDLDMYGDFKISEVVGDIYGLVAQTVPSVFGEKAKAKPSSNYFTYHFRIKNINSITKFYDKELNFHGDIYSSNGYVFGNTQTLYGKINLPQISRGDYIIGESQIEMYSINGLFSVYTSLKSIEKGNISFENINLAMGAANDSIGLNLNWNGGEKSDYSGFFSLDTKFIPHENDSTPRIEVNISPSQFIFGETIWQLGETHINYDNSEVEIENLKLANANQILNVKGYISKDPDKILSFIIDNVDVSNVNPITQPSGYEFGGILSGSGRVSNIYEIPMFTANVNINDLSINQEQLGKLNLSSRWDNQSKAFVMSGTNKYVEMKGTYLTEIDSLDASIILKNLKLDIFDKYLNAYEISGLKGDANGTVMITGSLKKPTIDGTINLKQAEFTYDYLKLRALTEDKVYIGNDRIYFENFKVKDENGNIGTINGGIYHDNFKNFRFGLLANLEDFKVMNTKLADNNLFYGTVYASGGLTVEGTPSNFSIYAGATTGPNTKFVLPMEDNYHAQNTNYITFITPEDRESDISSKSFSTTNYSIKLDIDVKNDAEVQIVFDPRTGDRIKANGEGMLKIEYTSDEELYMYGEIEVTKGDYLFTLENIINKRFSIPSGGTITWDGNPYEGKLNLDAVYTTTVSLKELMREEYDSTDNNSKRATVECHMHLIGNLMSPEIQFSINIPNGSDKVKTKLASLTQDEINKQLLYVLVINQFYDPNAEMLNQTGTTTNAVGVTTTQMLSNQLSNWLSKIVKDVDVGFKYSPGTEFSGQEVEVALSTQIFNDRLLINGNLGISDKKFNNENIVGDVEVQWKLNKKGSLRIKGFSRKNTDIEAEYGPYTTGAGIFYTEEFDTFGELMRKIWNDITFKQAREKHKAKKAQKKTSAKKNKN
ncbi:MAG: translocation/assembly module TamB [Bacteroidales bacterium]|nr:translocation/assembly module TamB [Bacteroidales bacterium]